MAIDFDDSTMFDVEVPDFLVGPGDARYTKPTWAKGKNFLCDMRGKLTQTPATGWLFNLDKIDNDLRDAFETIIAEDDEQIGRKKMTDETRRARQILIEHENGTRQDYFVLTNPKFYPLALGLPQLNALSDPRNQVGFAAGTMTYLKKEEGATVPTLHNTSSFIAVLCVEQSLLNAGYLDSMGRPKPVQIRAEGYGQQELFKAWNKHYELIKFMRNNGYPKAQFYQYAMGLVPSPGMVSHGVGKARAILGTHPAQFTKEYGESVLAPVEIRSLLAEYVLQREDDIEGKPRLVIGGTAIDWCKDEIKRSQENQEKYNPQGKLSFGYNKELPVWLVKRLRQDSLLTEDPDTDGEMPAVTNAKIGIQDDPEEEDAAGMEEAKNALIGKIRFFKTRAPQSPLIVEMEKSLVGIESGIFDEVMTSELIERAGAAQQALRKQSGGYSSGK